MRCPLSCPQLGEKRTHYTHYEFLYSLRVFRILTLKRHSPSQTLVPFLRGLRSTNRADDLRTAKGPQSVLTSGEIALLREFRGQMENLTESQAGQTLDKLTQMKAGLPRLTHRGTQLGPIGSDLNIVPLLGRHEGEDDLAARLQRCGEFKQRVNSPAID